MNLKNKAIKQYCMHCYVTLSNIFLLMHVKMFIYYSLLRRLANYMICLCFIVLSVTVCTVGYAYSFCGDQIIMDSVSFLSMII